MSFWPLATTIIDALRSAQGRGPWMELGAGNGSLAARWKTLGLHPLLLDHDCSLLRSALVRLNGDEGDAEGGHPRREGSKPPPASWKAVAAQAQRLPLATASLSGAVLADLVRQIPVPQHSQVARELFRCLKPGAPLVILEDSPHARNEAEENYREALGLLASVQSYRAQATLPPGAATALFSPLFGLPRREGSLDNELEVADPEAPLRWLRAWQRERSLSVDERRRDPGPSFEKKLDRLERKVENSGMRYGQYWFQIYERTARAEAA